MKLKSSAIVGVGLVVSLLLLSLEAHAVWPSAGIRTMTGQMCHWGFKLDTQPIFCPFVSESDTWYAPQQGTTYVDYHVSSSLSGQATTASACRQSYTGTAYVCGTASQRSGTGNWDMFVYGFAFLSGTSTINDYYYVDVSSSETIDVVYGVGYGT